MRCFIFPYVYQPSVWDGFPAQSQFSGKCFWRTCVTIYIIIKWPPPQFSIPWTRKIFLLYSGNYGNLWQLELLFFFSLWFLLWHVRIRMLLHLVLASSVAMPNPFTGYKNIKFKKDLVQSSIHCLYYWRHYIIFYLLQIADTEWNNKCICKVQRNKLQ